MKVKYLLLFALLIFINTQAQNHFDTLFVKQVGVAAHHIYIEETNVPWTLNVLKIDLTAADIKMETVKANDRKASWERTSSMASRKNYDEHFVIGAINGDFYDGSGVPVGMQIIDGEIITPSNNWSALGFDVVQRPFIQRISFSGEVFANGTSKNINGINKSRDTDQLILYNSYFGNSTATNQFGTEVMIEPIGEWFVNEFVQCIVIQKIDGQGNLQLQTGKAVLSGHGTSKTFIDNNINVGDTITILNSIAPAPSEVKELINGFPKIIRDGENCALDCYAEEGGSTNFATARHPRTAAGFSEDQRYLFMVTVDGRQTISKGMSLPELADFMIGLGVYRAVNLDGGGSTTMVVRNEIANSPSDAGGERSVSNALMVVSTEPEGSLHQVKLNTEFAKVFWDDNYQFTTTGYDEYFNSTHQLNNVDINYSISHDFGAITSTGLFTAGILVDTGYVITEYNGLKDSALVVVNSIKKLIISPSVVVTDTTQTIDFSVQSIDLDGVDQKLSNSEFQWSSTNSFTGVVDSIGVFTGLNSGVTEIIVRWENVSDTAIVSVELENGSQVLSSFDNINDWYLTGDDIDSTSSTISITSETSSEGNESLRLDYQFTYQSGVIAWAYLNTDIQVSGVPANLGVDVKSDGQNHSIAFVVEIYGEDEFALLTHKTANVPGIFEPIWSNFDNPIPIETGASFHFPIFIKQIAVILGSEKQSGETYNGTIYFDNLRAVYPDAVTNVENQGIVLTEYKLYQNYPNPFNPSTTIKYEIPDQVRNDNLLVSLKVYDILGREVATLVNKEQSPGSYEVEFNASSVSRRISSGIYFYRLNVGGNIMSKKMLLLK